MASHGFDITITDGSIDVRRDPVSSLKERVLGSSIVIGAIPLILCLLIFTPDKHGGPSMWSDLVTNPVSTSPAIVPIFGIIVFSSFAGWFGFRWVLAAWPADDALHCDRSDLTVSRAKWLDSENRLSPESFPIMRISQMRYGAIASAKGSTIYGLRFYVDGKKQKLLAGLEAPEADKILKALKAFGIDVPDDPTLLKRIRERLESRGEDTSWMDRSWMDRT